VAAADLVVAADTVHNTVGSVELCQRAITRHTLVDGTLARKPCLCIKADDPAEAVRAITRLAELVLRRGAHGIVILVLAGVRNGAVGAALERGREPRSALVVFSSASGSVVAFHVAIALVSAR